MKKTNGKKQVVLIKVSLPERPVKKKSPLRAIVIINFKIFDLATELTGLAERKDESGHPTDFSFAKVIEMNGGRQFLF